VLPELGLVRVGTLARHNTILLLREPGPVLSRLLMPLVAVLVFQPLYRAAMAAQGRAAGTEQAVTGVLMLFSLLAISIAGTAILAERSWHTWDRLRSTQLRPLELLVGKALPVFAVLLLQQVVVLGFGVVVLGLPVPNAGLLAVAVVSWALALLCIGAALGTVLRSQAEFSAAQDIGGFLFSSLGGALVPLASMPGWARDIAPASPAYWGMSALRGALADQPGVLLRAAGVLLGIAVVAATVAALRIRHGWGRSRLI